MKKTLIYIEMLMIAVIIGLLNWWSAPTMSDDIMYRFVCQKDWTQPFERIQSVADVIRSQILHYSCINGRSITHGTAQVMLNLVPDKLTKIINTGLFLLFIWLTTCYVAKKKENRPVIMMLVFGSIFLAFNGFYTGFIWFLGACTYLLALTFTIIFLLILKRFEKEKMTLKWAFLPLLSFLLGWSHEAIALPLSLSFALYLVVNHKGAWKYVNTYCMAGYIMGMLMILTSPSLWWRADIEGMSLAQRLISGCANIALGIRISWVLFIALVVVFFRNRLLFKTFFRQQFCMLFAWLMALGIIFVCGTSVERVSICADFLSMLILLDLWQGKKLLRWQYQIIGAVGIAAIIVAVPAVKLNIENYNNYLYHKKQLENPGQQIIKVRQLSDEGSAWQWKVLNKYTFQTVEFSFYNCYMAFDQRDINAVAVAQLYGKPSVIMLPEDIVNRVEKDSTAFTQWEEDEHHHLMVRKIGKNAAVNHVTFELGEEIPLKFYQRILSYKGDEYELDAFNYEVIEICGQNYLIITIPPTNIYRRIKNIRID